MILLLWLFLLLSCMITYIHYCFIIIVITMLIMIVYYYVYKRLQQFLTRLTGLRKGLVTVNVNFYELYFTTILCNLSALMFILIINIHTHTYTYTHLHICIYTMCTETNRQDQHAKLAHRTNSI